MVLDDVMKIINKRVDKFKFRHEGITLSLVGLAMLLTILYEKSIIDWKDIRRILDDE